MLNVSEDGIRICLKRDLQADWPINAQIIRHRIKYTKNTSKDEMLVQSLIKEYRFFQVAMWTPYIEIEIE